MRKTVFLALLGILILGFLNFASAYYGGYYNSKIYHDRVEDFWNSGDFDEEEYCKYWDRGELEWDRDRVCEWMNKGDRREQVLRTRAAIWQSNSFDARYNINSGKTSEDVFYYDRPTERVSPSSWRYKRTYDPRIDNEYVMGRGYYYYQPRYDYETQTFNWRF